MKNIIFLISVFAITISYSQDKKYATECLTKLVSPEFHGRGFTEMVIKLQQNLLLMSLKKII